MKAAAILIILGFFRFNMNAQKIVCPSGEYYQTTTNKLSWTLGEPVNETVSKANITLTQGYQQSKLIITSISENKISGLKIKVYPNPLYDFLNIETTNMNELDIKLFDMKGNLLIQSNLKERNSKIDMKKYGSASYILKIYENNQILNIYNIIKL